MIEMADGAYYEYIKANVVEGGIRLRYKIPESYVRGRDFIDDRPARFWRDDEILKVIAEYLGVTSGMEEIEVIRDYD